MSDKERFTLPVADTQTIMNFLRSVSHSKCPWCGSNSWDVITTGSAMGQTVSLEGGQSIQFGTPDDNVQSMQYIVDPKPAGVYMKLRCRVCCCELRFDYPALLKKIEQQGGQNGSEG